MLYISSRFTPSHFSCYSTIVSTPVHVLVCLSVAVIKGKAIGREKDLFGLKIIVHCQWKPRQVIKAGTCGRNAEAMEKCYLCLASSVCSAPLPIQPRTTCLGMTSPQQSGLSDINCQSRKCPTDMPQSDLMETIPQLRSLFRGMSRFASSWQKLNGLFICSLFNSLDCLHCETFTVLLGVFTPKSFGRHKFSFLFGKLLKSKTTGSQGRHI